MYREYLPALTLGLRRISVTVAIWVGASICAFMSARILLGWPSQAITGVAALLSITACISVGVRGRQVLWSCALTGVGYLLLIITAQLPLHSLAYVVLSPVAEEALFREYCFKGLRSGFGFIPAALISAILFAFIHFPLTSSCGKCCWG
jgi:membrane protease YdiL (CAAX protease family)